jgi:hypothetical protein
VRASVIGGRRFFEALSSSADENEFACFVCSRVRRFAPYPLVSYVFETRGREWLA